MRKKNDETKEDREFTDYLVRTKAFYLYIRDHYDALSEVNEADDLDYTMEICNNVYEHGMEEGFISPKQKKIIDDLIRRMTILEDEDDILDRVDPGMLTYDIEEEE